MNFLSECFVVNTERHSDACFYLLTSVEPARSAEVADTLTQLLATSYIRYTETTREVSSIILKFYWIIFPPSARPDQGASIMDGSSIEEQKSIAKTTTWHIIVGG